MKVIPVIDVLNGKVVHAIRGKRKEYKTLESVLTNSVDPFIVAQTFETLGFKEIYLADLDAILGRPSNYMIYEQITHGTGLKLMVDAGINDLTIGKQVLEHNISELIIGTETLRNKKFIKEAIKLFGTQQLIISLDLMDEKTLTTPVFDGSTDPNKLLKEFKELGILKFLILDLARVGSNEGININFLKKVRANITGEIYIGGGVRNIADLSKLKTLNISGALVATSLHSGRITMNDLKNNLLM